MYLGSFLIMTTAQQSPAGHSHTQSGFFNEKIHQSFKTYLNCNCLINKNIILSNKQNTKYHQHKQQQK